MKRSGRWLPAAAGGLVALVTASCEKPPERPAAAATMERLVSAPLLPVRTGDFWRYDVRVRIPADVTSPGAAEVEVGEERVRRYLGKIPAAEGLPAVDCFEVTSPGDPVEREFVEILPDRILLRGSLIVREETLQPLWLDPAVPFVIAGAPPGTELPEISATGGTRTRKTRVVSHEEITTPAGVFSSIRLLMTGVDGGIELHRSLWFAPGIGIVREEKTRHGGGKLLSEETQELLETSLRR